MFLLYSCQSCPTPQLTPQDSSKRILASQVAGKMRTVLLVLTPTPDLPVHLDNEIKTFGALILRLLSAKT